jgi:hypothetical protein
LIRPSSAAVSPSIIPLPFDQPTDLTTRLKEQNNSNNKEENSFEATMKGKALAGNSEHCEEPQMGSMGAAQSKPNSKTFSTPSTGSIFLGQLLLWACIRHGLALV